MAPWQRSPMASRSAAMDSTSRDVETQTSQPAASRISLQRFPGRSLDTTTRNSPPRPWTFQSMRLPLVERPALDLPDQEPRDVLRRLAHGLDGLDLAGIEPDPVPGAAVDDQIHLRVEEEPLHAHPALGAGHRLLRGVDAGLTPFQHQLLLLGREMEMLRLE